MAHLKMAYADPPYLGCAKILYGEYHRRAGDYDKLVTHIKLVKKLMREYPDGWALSLLTSTLPLLWPYFPKKIHIGAWVKRYGPFKKNVNPAYFWEPVVFYGGRPRGDKKKYIYDWVCAQVVTGPFFPGRKPDEFSFWVFEMLGMEAGDKFIDLFPGSKAVGKAWQMFSRQAKLFDGVK
jgi:hypothetical protein